jgi:alpha-tubulin suppressor-like RCC1 family protein
VSVVGGFTDWSQVSAGDATSTGTAVGGVRLNGTAWGWGLGTQGRVGDGNLSNRSSPVSVVSSGWNWLQISKGSYASFAISNRNALWAWGPNDFGSLGINASGGRSSPELVAGGLGDWVQIAASDAFSIGLRNNGTALSWGRNTRGELGQNTSINRSSPVDVVGWTDWRWVASGGNTAGAIRVDGTAWMWGTNNLGQLGDNSTTSRSSPVSVVGGFTDWSQIEAAGRFTLGLRANGTLWSWGVNGQGQLGNNSVTSSRSPVSVVGGFTDWRQIACGYSQNFAIRANGTLWSWGQNTNGALGVNTTGDRSSPVSVVGGFSDWVTVTGGWNMGAALRVATS